jgi:type I restriction enzyme S subunit
MRALTEARPRYGWTPVAEPPVSTRRVPRGWLPSRFADTGLYVNGVAFKPTDWGRSGRPIIRIQNLSGFNPEYNHTLREVGPDNLIADGDLLVSWSATLDAFIWEGPEGVLNQHIFKVVPNAAAVRHRFLYWLLKHEIRELADSQHAHGLAMMHINRGPFLSHSILLPPLDEQERIVARVDELMALCHALDKSLTTREEQRDQLTRASLARLTERTDDQTDFRERVGFHLNHFARVTAKPDQIDPLRQTVLALAVRGRLVEQSSTDESAAVLLARVAGQKQRMGAERVGRDWVRGSAVSEPFPLPSGWAWTRIGSAVERVTVGFVGSMTDHYVPVGVPFLRSQNVRPGRLRKEGLIYISPEFHQSIRKSAVAPGDVVVVRSGSVGTACTIPSWLTEANCSDLVVVQRPLAVHPGYLSFYLNSLAAEHIAAGSVGMALTHFNTKSVATMPLPLPPIAEQHRIVAKVDELMVVCDELERSLTAVQTGRARLLEAVLHEALADAGADAGRALAAAEHY